MADRPILKIEVDSSDFDDFQKKFQQYQQEVAAQPEAWRNVNTEVGKTKTSFEEAAEAFHKMSAGAAAPKLDSAFAKTTKNAQQSERAWFGISKHIEKASKHLSGLARLSLNLGAFGALGATAAVGVEAFKTTFDAASSLAGINKNARALGLKPGEEQAFNDTYEKAGGDSSLLAKMAAAKSDRSQWRPLLASGISQQDIESKSATELSAEFLEKAGAAFKAHDKNHMGGRWADAVGLSAFADTNALRLAGSYNHGDYEAMHRQYTEAVPKLSIAQKEADASSQFISDIKMIGDELKNNFFAALVPLEPMFKDLAKQVGDAFTAYAKSGELKHDIEVVVEAFEDLGKAIKWVRDQLPSFTLDENKMAPEDKAALNWGKKVWNGAKQSWDDIGNYTGWWGGKHQNGEAAEASGTFKPAPNRNFYLQALEHQQNLPDGLLDTIEDIESKRGKHNLGPMTKYGRAKGAFQLIDDTAKRYNVTDPYDERQAAAGASLYLRDLHKRYKGDTAKAIAAYNWGEGNLDKDIAKWGDKWAEHLPDQTKGYLRQAAEHGMNLGQNSAWANAGKNGMKIDNKIVTEDEARRQGENPPALSGDGFFARALGTLSQSIDRLRDTMAGLRTPDFQRPSTEKVVQHQGGPFNIHVNVHTPAGANSAVTMGSLPQ